MTASPQTVSSSIGSETLPLYALKVPQGWIGAQFIGQDLAALHTWRPTYEALYEKVYGTPYPADDSPIGESLFLVQPPQPLRVAEHPPVRRTLELLWAYLSGEEADLASIPVTYTHAKGFFRTALEEARKIPPGTVVSYGALAAKAGSPGAARAVGQAMATNRIAIVVPCHRVVGSAGKLTGYAGGLDYKRDLLRLEGCDPEKLKPLKSF